MVLRTGLVLCSGVSACRSRLCWWMPTLRTRRRGYVWVSSSGCRRCCGRHAASVFLTDCVLLLMYQVPPLKKFISSHLTVALKDHHPKNGMLMWYVRLAIAVASHRPHIAHPYVVVQCCMCHPVVVRGKLAALVYSCVGRSMQLHTTKHWTHVLIDRQLA